MSADGADLKRVESFQWPHGHINHLNESQLSTLDQFKKLCEAKGYYRPSTDTSPASHDDETLLRYLRARKFVVQDAYKQYKETEDWRRENKLDDLYMKIDVDEYDQSRRLYPQWTGRRDKRGIPLYMFEVSHLDNKAIAAYQSNTDSKLQPASSKVPIKMLRLFALYENLTNFVLPLCSTIPNRTHPETPISQSSNIVDISGVSLMQFWKLKNHMQDASVLATAHYPETLDRIFLTGAPGFFNTVWSWIKKWFDPITVSKIFVLSPKETLPTLLKFVDIENIPKKYGGKLEFNFGDMPNLDADIIEQLKWKNPVTNDRQTFPTGPIKWQHGANGDLEAVAVGSVNGKLRNEVIAGIHPRAEIAQMSISPGLVQTTSGPQVAKNHPAVDTQVSNGITAPVSAALEKQPAEPSGHVPDTSRAGTATLPVENMTETREGTSSTRYEQQSHTLAHGNVAEGTPAIARDGQGEKQAIMEPSTIGQAAKTHPVPDASEPPTMVEQAKQTAESVLHSATETSHHLLASVGLAKKEEPAQPVRDNKDDTAIDGMDGKHVEEFLRAKTMSEPQA